MEGIKNSLLISDEIVMNKIPMLRGKRVMIDKDIAELYGVYYQKIK